MLIREYDGYMVVKTEVDFSKENYEFAQKVIDNMFDYSKCFFKCENGKFQFRLVEGRVK